jgi:uncharacterized iron-regulated membrane protein
MTDTALPRADETSGTTASTGSTSGSGLKPFVTRLHFYIGLFVGPFVLVAAITGTLFVLTPQIETYLYREQLRTGSTGEARPLAAQAAAARAYVGDAPRLFAVRPAPAPGWTTRVMYSEPGLGDSESRAIFVDPATLDIRGDLVVYGTSGTLPLRTGIDHLHRNLLLGDFGRYYSELAASWLWAAVLGGVVLWYWRRGGGKAGRSRPGAALGTRRLHGLIGVWISVGLVFLSATGLTWSQWAGGRIDQLRGALGWVTPSVSLALEHGADPAGGHAHHDHAMPAPGAAATGPAGGQSAVLDRILEVSRAAGIDSDMLEIRPPKAAGQAWMVREYDRSWPTQVDTIAIDPTSMTVTSRADFETFPIIAKLIRWGIDAHMGILFGFPNQLLMAGLGIALTVTIAYGYRLWWQRRPAPGTVPRTLAQSWLRLSLPLKTLTLLAALALGWALPLMGVSLAAFLLVDILRWKASPGGRRRAAG